MSTQYSTGTFIGVLAAFIVVASQAFPSHSVGWLAFAVGVVVVIVSIVAQLDSTRGALQRAVDAGLLVVAGFMLVFGLEASGTAVIWLSFAFALGVEALALTGLTAHEISNWRSVHQLSQLHWFSQNQNTTRSLDRTETRAA